MQALAYRLMDEGYHDSDVDIYATGLSTTYTSPFSSAMTAWNNCYTPCTIAHDSSSLNSIATHSGGSAYGLYIVLASSQSDPDHTTTRFLISMSSNYFPYMSFNERKSVCCHEIGHAFGLDDITSGTAVMNVNRDRSVIYNPKTDDVHGVEASW